jgi:hypothetical protein
MLHPALRGEGLFEQVVSVYLLALACLAEGKGNPRARDIISASEYVSQGGIPGGM